jgi:hypothetical protein
MWIVWQEKLERECCTNCAVAIHGNRPVGKYPVGLGHEFLHLSGESALGNICPSIRKLGQCPLADDGWSGDFSCFLPLSARQQAAVGACHQTLAA